ncbi:cell division protein FtsW [Candidatus Gottesmanbacteria bacterium RIFCSPHIGHO2_02_FULL_40_24]|uniref:Probable peptidoglycan glycosyltransferase FtsW n=1 Tax=Candidatus Gottesmanbacteria bacterium RIFCSPHIGHO2_01_FULL_40_15 TaxID=1798376 RepID=A0A1F5Z256_9BACT|nr:MAG: cell division protein FtsW [Candidatus Gottesmanbacteria bacterium RIFCSPHIGHO2_01_FULL_40_15]OGG16236.1 MAG: cell division protein FtsW [Candidatus Gottesmanbacteria bacterium RIFCSPHIGHO2_02_FULL_40_24]OGG23228.1 MAG: cell division protein FtsW [Candidatus Gottesmanbacteria bacterium RIFCSPLOWO2_01_FULL_40_10]OGG25905.1 MAG: cell division protein FtsW [Candidatus Gottesmanbacteria bacterium RIFCSPHIGHO2_12_FULL_40_13]OGG33768.1 MAG: cell division protein FtsW [Candidatus Gottesmanbact
MKKSKNLTYLTQKKKSDFWLLLLTFAFTFFGILMIFEASNVAAFVSFNDKFHFVKDQFLWAVLGFILLIIFSKIHYRKLFVMAVPMLTVTIIALIAVLIPGIGIKALGARRWINLSFFSFQPSELAKISLILYLSAWFTNKEKGRFFHFLFLTGLIVGLVILQPDLGTAVILTAIFLAVYFISNAPLFHFLILLPGAILSVIFLALISPYRYQRLMTFFDPNRDPLGASYHIRQILISLGSGGFIGLGLGASRQKYQYLPEATTDSIFAIIGEEAGFLGTSFIILLFIVFLYRIYLIVKHSPDNYARLLSSGILSLMAFQIIINLGAMVAIFPLTGVPLPFFSYGGSNLIVTLFSVGILLNISKFRVKTK